MSPMTGYEDDRNFDIARSEFMLKIESARSRQANIQNKGIPVYPCALLLETPVAKKIPPRASPQTREGF